MKKGKFGLCKRKGNKNEPGPPEIVNGKKIQEDKKGGPVGVHVLSRASPHQLRAAAVSQCQTISS